MAENRRELVDPTLCSALGGAYLDLGDEAGRVRILRRAAQHHPKDANVLNELAWALATSPDARARNGREAVTLAASACERTRWKDASILDTYAAALAEAGQWQEAERRENEALALGGNSPVSVEFFRKRVALYRSRKPLRESFGPAYCSRKFLRERKFTYAN